MKTKEQKAWTEYCKLRIANRKQLQGYTGLGQLEQLWEAAETHQEAVRLEKIMAIAEDLPALYEYPSREAFLAAEDIDDWCLD